MDRRKVVAGTLMIALGSVSLTPAAGWTIFEALFPDCNYNSDYPFGLPHCIYTPSDVQLFRLISASAFIAGVPVLIQGMRGKPLVSSSR